MGKTILLNDGWHFTKENTCIPTAVSGETVTLPHTWNAADGQDGGNDYYRGTCWYTRTLAKPEIPAGGRVILQLDGAAMTAAVFLNGEKLAIHMGGYSAFRTDLTDDLKDDNLLAIRVDNSDNDTVYPQKADFTFYGGIYRDVTLHVVPAEHFALPANGAAHESDPPRHGSCRQDGRSHRGSLCGRRAERDLCIGKSAHHGPGGEWHGKGCFHADRCPPVGRYG